MTCPSDSRGAELQAAQQSGNAKSLLSMIEEIVKLKPEAELAPRSTQIAALIKLDQQDTAGELAKKLATPIGENPAGLPPSWSEPNSGVESRMRN